MKKASPSAGALEPQVRRDAPELCLGVMMISIRVTPFFEIGATCLSILDRLFGKDSYIGDSSIFLAAMLRRAGGEYLW